MLLFGDNDSHVNETTAKQECSLSLFGPIFLMFQHSLICWQKCLGPLTAKVTESTTHPADSKQGIWGMAFKQWLSHKPFCLQMLWKAYRLMIFFLGLQQFESPASLPKSPAPSRLGLQLFYLPFQPHSCGIGYAGVFPTNESFQGFILFICIDRHCPNTGQGDALCPAGQVSGFNFARGTLHVGSSLTVLWVNRENWTSGREINGNCQKKKKKKVKCWIQPVRLVSCLHGYDGEGMIWVLPHVSCLGVWWVWSLFTPLPEWHQIYPPSHVADDHKPEEDADSFLYGVLWKTQLWK